VTWKSKLPLAAALAIAMAAPQPASNTILTNLDTARWSHDKGDPPGMESVFLREDARTGGIELLVRFPAGHVIAPHWHDANERMIVLEGRMMLRQESGETSLKPGAFAFLPAHDVQRLSCAPDARCTVYLAWDASPKSLPAK
jgi:quercetin dioxygenase-like cupin family protein